MFVYVRGGGSVLAEELSGLVPIVRLDRAEPIPLDGERYLFTAGRILQQPLVDQDRQAAMETVWINALSVIRDCDRLLSENPKARICIVGSESGFKWSFDGAYAAAKAAIHRYVETRRLSFPDQQLVCVAPTCIVGSGMNLRRNADGVAALERRRQTHPKGRWLEPIEVARMIHFLLCVDRGYTTNIVIRMNGGEHCR